MKLRLSQFLFLVFCLAPVARAQTAATNSSAAAPAKPVTVAAPSPAEAVPGPSQPPPTTVPAPTTPAVASQSATSPAPQAVTASAAEAVTNQSPENVEFARKLAVAREQRQQKNPPGARQILESLLKSNGATEFHRQALYELALVEQDDKQLGKAQQILAQYLNRYPDDPTVPETLLRQGLIFRQMGVNTLAVSKFYAVMSSALKLKLDNIDYYKKLVLQAQMEIADTYYLDGKFEESADFFNRILKSDGSEMNREELQYKLVRSLSYLTNHVETSARAQSFLDQFPKSSNVPEIRFLLASALKALGRNQDSLKQVMLLLQSQQDNVRKDPETWIYWQRRAGNEIANQLYKEADYIDALEIYVSLADLDRTPAWQVPIWYQSGMIYEQLQQWQKATDTYTQIMGRKKELNDTNSTPVLDSLIDMAKWRKDYITWMQQAKADNQSFHPIVLTNAPAAGTQ